MSVNDGSLRGHENTQARSVRAEKPIKDDRVSDNIEQPRGDGEMCNTRNVGESQRH